MFNSVAETEQYYQDRMAISTTQRSPETFIPDEGDELTIKGVISYFANSGSFKEIKAVAEIEGIIRDLRIELASIPVPVEDMPENFAGIIKDWSFNMSWNGKDWDGFPVVAGKYIIKLTATVVKVEKKVKVDKQGKEEEKIVEKKVSKTKQIPIWVSQ